MSKKPRNSGAGASTLTESGSVELTEDQLNGVAGGASRVAANGDSSEVTENVTINFAKVKYVYTPQK